MDVEIQLQVECFSGHGGARFPAPGLPPRARWQYLEMIADRNALTLNSESHRETVEQKFARLVDTWMRDTIAVSWPHRIAMHAAYQEMIGLGKPALPLILRELERENGPWYWALAAISGTNPVPIEDRGRYSKMREHWLRWGREAGYLTA